MKPLAFAADAGELIFIYGFSMAVSLFDRLRSARSQIVEKCRYSTAKPIIAQNTNLVAEKIAVPRTRGSVRRASGFVQIAFSLIDRTVRVCDPPEGFQEVTPAHFLGTRNLHVFFF